MEVIGQLGSVGAVLALLGAALWWLRRRGSVAVLPRRAGGRLLKSLERLPLGPQHTLHLVRLGEEVLVVGCSPAGCALLGRMAIGNLEGGRAAAPEARA